MAKTFIVTDPTAPKQLFGKRVKGFDGRKGRKWPKQNQHLGDAELTKPLAGLNARTSIGREVLKVVQPTADEQCERMKKVLEAQKAKRNKAAKR